MNQDQLQKIKRHLIGLLDIIDSEIEIKDDTIKIKEELYYYDNRGRIVDIKITRKLDIVK